MLYRVSVEKLVRHTGVVEIEADSPDYAQGMVEGKIDSGELPASEVEWDGGECEPNTFATTGDVE